MPPPPFSIEPSERASGPFPLSCFRLPTTDGSVRLMLVGELDLVTAHVARDAIRHAQAESSALSCDLGDVWFVDLTGLRVLLDAATYAALTGRRLTIANCPSIVPRMLRVLGFDHMLEIEAARRPSVRPARPCARRRPHVF